MSIHHSLMNPAWPQFLNDFERLNEKVAACGIIELLLPELNGSASEQDSKCPIRIRVDCIASRR
jgi:hypothetical protein